MTDDFAIRLRRELAVIEAMLIDKNQRYGNSALDPVRIFSRADTAEQIRVRIDDKLSRIRNQTTDDEDAELDLIGYLLLLRLSDGQTRVDGPSNQANAQSGRRCDHRTLAPYADGQNERQRPARERLARRFLRQRGASPA